MSFLKTKKTEIKIIAPISAEEAAKIQPHIETIFSNLSTDEFELLARALKNPIIKTLAIAELKKRLSN